MQSIAGHEMPTTERRSHVAGETAEIGQVLTTAGAPIEDADSDLFPGPDDVTGRDHPDAPDLSADEESRSVENLRGRLQSEFPTSEPEMIDLLLARAWSLTDGSKVQQYRVILAERQVRQGLRRANQAPVSGGSPG